MLIQDTSDSEPSQGQVPLGRTNHTVVTWNDKLYLWVSGPKSSSVLANHILDLEALTVSNGLTMSGLTIHEPTAGVSWIVLDTFLSLVKVILRHWSTT